MSAHATLTTLFHRLHSAGNLKDPNGNPFQSVAAAVDLVYAPPRVSGGQRVFLASTYEEVVNKSSAGGGASQGVTGAQPIRDEHWRDLEPVVADAAELAARCSAEPAALEAVFGRGVDSPIGTFKTISVRLAGFGQKNFAVNYSSADDMTGADGMAVAWSGLIQLSGSLVTALSSKKNRAMEVLVHEAAHETDASIVDLGYSGSAGFENMTLKDKLHNADHYADVAARVLGTSPYTGTTFTPQSGVLAGLARRDQFRKAAKAANDGLEKLWSLSLNLTDLLRGLAPGVEPGTNRPTGRPDSYEVLREKKDMVAAIKVGWGLPKSYVTTEVDYKLIQTATMVLVRAKKKLDRAAKTADPRLIERLMANENAFDLASAAIWQVGGFEPDRDASDARHYAIAECARDQFKQIAYP